MENNVNSEEIMKVDLPHYHQNTYYIAMVSKAPLKLPSFTSQFHPSSDASIFVQLTEYSSCLFLLFSEYFSFLFTDKQKHNLLFFLGDRFLEDKYQVSVYTQHSSRMLLAERKHY